VLSIIEGNSDSILNSTALIISKTRSKNLNLEEIIFSA